MLDNLGLIHMNGRVYDPELGKFISADPAIPAPVSTQGYNRYSYVFNNPLSASELEALSTQWQQRMAGAALQAQQAGKLGGMLARIAELPPGSRVDQPPPPSPGVIVIPSEELGR